MVAISLYRGNLHRVPDVPRKWPMPKQSISLRDFKLLLRKRSKALSRLRSTKNPDHSKQHQEEEEEGMGDNDCSKQQQQISPHHSQSQLNIAPNPVNVNVIALNEISHQKPREDAPSKFKEIYASGSFSGAKSVLPEKDDGSASKDLPEDKAAGSAEAKIDEVTISLDVLSDTEKRKRELEKNLHILNEKKHKLVQALKQILNVEEEIKKRNSIQMSGVRAIVPLQMEATIDTGSDTRHAFLKISSEGNFNGDLEGESEDISNHNAHARQLHHMSSTSPSAASPLRRPVPSSLQHNTAPLTIRPSIAAAGHAQTSPNMMMGVTASPSRFAPSGHQGHALNLPPVSVSGVHFTASSPSPAASGGSSVFRDARLTSPWN